jgi:hypothetical protein
MGIFELKTGIVSHAPYAPFATKRISQEMDKQ